MNEINNYEQKYSLLKKRIELSDTKVKSLTKSLRDAEEKATFWEEQSRACSSSRGALAKNNFENKKTITGLEKRIVKYENHIAKLCELFDIDSIEKLLPYIQEQLLLREAAAQKAEKNSIVIDYQAIDDIELPSKFKGRRVSR